MQGACFICSIFKKRKKNINLKIRIRSRSNKIFNSQSKHFLSTL